MSASEQPSDRAETEPEEANTQSHLEQPPGGNEVPLFLRDLNDGRKGNPQDEKDEVGE